VGFTETSVGDVGAEPAVDAVTVEKDGVWMDDLTIGDHGYHIIFGIHRHCGGTGNGSGNGSSHHVMYVSN
jgi:hypothetical protein